MDSKTQVLHGDIESDVYVSALLSLDLCRNDQVLKRRRVLYGLKKAPVLWYRKWESIVRKLSFRRLQSDSCAYRRDNIIILIQVDDIILISNSKEAIQEMTNGLAVELDVKNLGKLRFFLSVFLCRIKRDILVATLLHKRGFETVRYGRL